MPCKWKQSWTHLCCFIKGSQLRIESWVNLEGGERAQRGGGEGVVEGVGGEGRCGDGGVGGGGGED